MSHTYLIDLYDLTKKRLQHVYSQKTHNQNNGAYLNGQIDALKEFKSFLALHYDCKLPRRLRGKYSD